jgi:hypothetical protein
VANRTRGRRRGWRFDEHSFELVDLGVQRDQLSPVNFILHLHSVVSLSSLIYNKSARRHFLHPSLLILRLRKTLEKEQSKMDFNQSLNLLFVFGLSSITTLMKKKPFIKSCISCKRIKLKVIHFEAPRFHILLA